MLKSILIGLDGSPHAHTAMELGFQWAKQFDALLVGIGVVDIPDICAARAVPIGGSSYKVQSDMVRMQRARQQVEHFLEDFALRCMDADVVAKLLEDEGLPFEQIILEAQRFDLIMLGQETHFTFATQDTPDKTLKKVLKRSPRPVVVVPEKLPAGKTIVVAYDGSLPAARTLHAFEATGLATEYPIKIVSVAKQSSEASRHAERAAEFLRWHEISAQAIPIASRSFPADVILEQASKLDAGLLVVGSYGRSVLHDFFLGSVTRTLLERSPVPLFVDH